MLKYKLVSRANPRKRNEKQFYAQLTGVQTIKRCDFLSLLEKRSSMSSADVKSFCNVLELVDNFGFLISFFFDKFIC